MFGGGDFGKLLVFPGLMRLSPPDGIKWFYTKEKPELSHSVFVASELLVCNRQLCLGSIEVWPYCKKCALESGFENLDLCLHLLRGT